VGRAELLEIALGATLVAGLKAAVGAALEARLGAADSGTR
jgi:hypothetical protein